MSKSTDLKLLTSEAAHTETLKQQTVFQRVVANYQNILEKTDTYQREWNIVIYGLSESTELQDAVQVKELFMERECADTVPEKYMPLGKV